MLAACNGSSNYQKSYVRAYFKSEGLELTCFSYEDEVYLFLDPVNWNVKNYWFNSREDEVIFDSLCEVNRDLSFKKIVRDAVDTYYGECYAENFCKIEVLSDTDFDVNHPKGVLLNDIVQLQYHSLKPFIDSDYFVPCGDIHKCPPEDGTMYNKLASEIICTDLHMLPTMSYVLVIGDEGAEREIRIDRSFARFSFTKLPDVLQPHTITVKLYETTGKVRTASLKFNDWENLVLDGV